MSFWFEEERYGTGYGLKAYIIIVLIVLLIGSLAYFGVIKAQLDSTDQGAESREEFSLPKESQQIEPVESNQLDKEEAVIRVVENVGPAVVKLTTERQLDRFNLFSPSSQERVEGEGSGVIIDQQGYIVTNNHVIKEADKIRVALVDGEQTYSGQVVGTDEVTDLAVVKIEVPERKLPVVKFKDSNELRVGQLAIAIGNPYGFSNTVTTGVVSALDRQLSLGAETELTNLIQTDAAINPGNSGGALLDAQGQVIGINTAIIESGEGIGFAIPSNKVIQIAEELIQKGKIIRPWLGIHGGDLAPEVAEEYGLKIEGGVYIAQVIEDAPADKAGLQRGDIIASLNGAQIAGISELRRKLGKHEIGEEVKITAYRDQETRTFTIKLGERP
jgi:S1-C subfamily serine protease